MSAPKLVVPYGCGRCGIPLPHGQQTGPGGLHGWERPSDVQILARMKARRLARVVARQGALPMPSGPVPEPLPAEHLAQIEARAAAATAGPWCTDSWEIYQGTEYKPGLSFWIGETCRGTSTPEQDCADAAFVAAARSDVPALVAEVRRLLAERHSTNESLDDAAKALRADRDRIAELERVIADAPASYVLMDRAAAVADRLTRTFAPTQALREDDEFHLHHTYRVPRDLPEPAGVQTAGVCKACGSMPEQWCPDCGACQRGCYDGFVDNSCVHAGASWVGVE